MTGVFSCPSHIDINVNMDHAMTLAMLFVTQKDKLDKRGSVSLMEMAIKDLEYPKKIWRDWATRKGINVLGIADVVVVRYMSSGLHTKTSCQQTSRCCAWNWVTEPNFRSGGPFIDKHHTLDRQEHPRGPVHYASNEITYISAIIWKGECVNKDMFVSEQDIWILAHNYAWATCVMMPRLWECRWK